MTSLAEAYRDVFGTHQNREALVCDGRTLLYAELEALVAARVVGLARLGVGRGDRVAIDRGNSCSAVVSLHAALRLGAAFCCLDSTSPAPRFREILEDLQPRLVITRSERLEEDPSLAFDFALLIDDEPAIGSNDSIHPVVSEAPAYIVYTSGSTGTAKGVVMSDGAVRAAADAILEYLAIAAEDRIFCALPLSFDYGLYQVLMAHRAGACVVLQDGVGFPAPLLDRIRDEAITVLAAVPPLFALLLRFETFAAESFPHLRALTNTGAAVPIEQVRKIRTRFPSSALYLMYGLSECKRVCYLPPHLTDAHPDSVGIPMRGCEVAIVDSEGNRVEPGATGQLVVRGPHLMNGYWHRPEATAQRLRPGPEGRTWLWTGDLFRQDSEGLLYFVGRLDDVFKSGGEKVAPVEVERVLERHEGVLEAAVVAHEDSLRGTRIHALILADDASRPSRASLRAHCARHLEVRKVPHAYEFVDDLPRTPHGKLDRQRLGSFLESLMVSGEES